MSEQNCIFCKIVRGELPSNKVYEDGDVMAFHDIRPLAPVHLLVIPKLHVASLAECTDEHQTVLGKIMVLVPKLAKEHGLNDGFRTIINTGRVGGQEVYHLHVHILGGPSALGPMLRRD
ncbi:MAG: histidine triad nucleotide-binding protein [Burkholderiales bacterium]|nr:histidine triad nucleotide-binding protein [Burkholderiales bacterium]PZN00509.1 MAG: histidine triad nucleotide-binding protein [Pseudomonadota bacterium]